MITQPYCISLGLLMRGVFALNVVQHLHLPSASHDNVIAYIYISHIICQVFELPNRLDGCSIVRAKL